MPQQPPRTPGGGDRSRRRDGTKGGSQRRSPAKPPSGGTRKGSQRGGAGGGAGSPQRRANSGTNGSKRDSGRDSSGTSRRRRDLRGAAVDLPNWVVEDLSRTTPNHRIADALEQLGEASVAFGEGRFQKALRHAAKAKDLAPRDATVREVLALSAYRTGDWKQALRELRTYRRLSGELTHVPVEMDVLRALGRDDEIPKVFRLLTDHGAKPGVLKEARVVYASHLLDRGDVATARDLVAPGRLSDRPFDEDLRLWYVAARAAAIDGDGDEARRLRNAILQHYPSFPGIDELESLIAKTG
jgi:tetratricopeptide (TPR) repeat protein